MEITPKIKQKIKNWEGCRLTAYRCPAGVLTIGYGHTGPDVSEGKKITRDEADALFYNRQNQKYIFAKRKVQFSEFSRGCLKAV